MCAGTARGLPQYSCASRRRGRRNPSLHEVALFEWTLTLAFDAADDPVVRFDDLAQLPRSAWPTLGFVLHPRCSCIQLRTNAPALRKATDAGEPLPAAGGGR